MDFIPQDVAVDSKLPGLQNTTTVATCKHEVVQYN
jgi:hypothetical protein